MSRGARRYIGKLRRDRRKERRPCCRHILIPLDGSDLAERAIPVVARIARGDGRQRDLARANRTRARRIRDCGDGHSGLGGGS